VTCSLMQQRGGQFPRRCPTALLEN